MMNDPQSHVVAITDVVNKENQLLVRYPAWVVASVLIAGASAFLLVGYFGYSDDPPLVRAVFYYPWPIFIWLCLLFLYCIVTIFRSMYLRQQLMVLLIASLLSILLISGVWFSGVVPSFASHPPKSLPIVLFVSVSATVVVLLLLATRWLPPARVAVALLLLPLAVACLALGANFTSIYLHTNTQAFSGSPQLRFGHLLLIWLLAATGIVGGFIALAASSAMLVFRLRIFANTVRFYFLVIGLLYLGLPALALVNGVVWLTGISYHTPFFQPSIGAVVAIVIFAIPAVKLGIEAFQRVRKAPGPARGALS